VIIPPSISMILYAMRRRSPPSGLFTAGILPSLLIGIGRRRLCPDLFRASRRCRSPPLPAGRTSGASTKEASWAIGTIVVIFGGIYGGVFTPTEAAGVAVVYSLFVAVVIYREIGWAELWEVIVNSI